MVRAVSAPSLLGVIGEHVSHEDFSGITRAVVARPPRRNSASAISARRDPPCPCCAPGCGRRRSRRCRRRRAFRGSGGEDRSFGAAWRHRVVDEEVDDRGLRDQDAAGADKHMPDAALANEHSQLIVAEAQHLRHLPRSSQFRKVIDARGHDVHFASAAPSAASGLLVTVISWRGSASLPLRATATSSRSFAWTLKSLRRAPRACSSRQCARRNAGAEPR